MNTNGGEQLDASASEGHAKTKAKIETIEPNAENGSLDPTNIDIVMKMEILLPNETEKQHSTIHEEIDNENCTEKNFLGDSHQIKEAEKNIASCRKHNLPSCLGALRALFASWEQYCRA